MQVHYLPGRRGEGRWRSTRESSEHRFTAPEVLLELPDTVSAWTSAKDVRKFYCIFEE